MWLLAALSMTLLYGVIRFGGVLETERWVLALAVGLAAVVYSWGKRRHEMAMLLPRGLRWALIAGAAYIALQCLPLPVAVLKGISPARAELAGAVGQRWAPLSVAPAATLLGVVGATACVLVFGLSREMAWRLKGKEWVAAVPLVAVASLEAALGLAQFFSHWPAGVARGTYINRNHFAGFLELGLLMAVGLAAATRGRSERRVMLRRGLGIVTTGLILTGIIHSLSRMGFVAALAGLAVFAGALLSRRLRPRGVELAERRAHRKWVAAVVITAMVGVFFIYLPPDQLVARFAALAATEEVNADMRLQIWRETTGLIRSYAVTGCGLGGYETAFLRHKTVAPLNTVDYAHNDYLQGLAELGLIGFGVWAMAAVWVMRRAWRWPAVAGALTAIALHSLVDFNLYIPVNAMAVAWVAGLGAVE